MLLSKFDEEFMETLFLLIPLSLVALVVAIIIFIRMNMTGQFDESEAAAWSVLMDDDSPTDSSNTSDGKTGRPLDLDQVS